MEFRGQYYFLSNAYQSPMDLEINGQTYHFLCAEAAFQACRAPLLASQLENKTSKEAKDIGKKAKTKEKRADWEQVRLSEMARVLDAKFAQNSKLRYQLLAISEPITMDVHYPDRFWGLVDGRGQNNMGKALTACRDRILEKNGAKVKKDPSVVTYKVQKGGMVVFDTETTGTSAKYDDILQITIVGQDGSVLLDTYVKPKNCKEWTEAQAVNHISPEMVKDAPDADKVGEVVRKIFEKADFIVGQNIGFDVKMVESEFGFDFKAKEAETKAKFPELSKDAWIETNNATRYLISYIQQLLDRNVKIADFPDEVTKHPLYNKLKKACHGVKAIPLMTDSQINNFAEENCGSIYIYDTMTELRKYSGERGGILPNYQLITAVKHFFPEDADRFENEAHDACADTLATLKVAIKLNELRGRELPLGTSVWEDKMFGIEEGIICHQVNCKGVVPQSGFSTRLFAQFPVLKEKFKNSYKEFHQKGESQFGKGRLDEVDRGLYAATLYSQEKHGDSTKTGVVYTDAEKLVYLVGRVCDMHPDKPIYLPVVWQNDVIVDGIGCGKAGETWEKLGPMFAELEKPNLFTVDTQTGEIQKIDRPKELEEDDFEIM